jgi:hypothetical protein
MDVNNRRDSPASLVKPPLKVRQIRDYTPEALAAAIH